MGKQSCRYDSSLQLRLIQIQEPPVNTLGQEFLSFTFLQKNILCIAVWWIITETDQWGACHIISAPCVV